MTVSVASSNISRTPLVEADKASSDAPLSASPQLHSSPQPFTDLLVEATSKVLRDGLEKPAVSGTPSHSEELTKGVAARSAKEERPDTRLKKSVSIDKSTPPVSIIVTPTPLIVIESSPLAVPTIAPLAKEATPKQVTVEAVTTIDVPDSKPSPTILNVDVVKDPRIESRVGKESEPLVPALAPHPQSVSNENAKATVPLGQLQTLTTEPPKPANVNSEIRTMPSTLINDLAPELHSPSSPPSQEAAIHPRESSTLVGGSESIAINESIPTNTSIPAKESVAIKASIPNKESVATKESESTGDHTSPSPVRTERSEPEVIPAWPIHPSIAAPAVNVAAPPSHITSPSLHLVDVAALVGAISRPIDEARGGYTVMIAMHPVELGHVQAVVTLHGTDLHVSITPQTQMGHDALTHAVDTLKTELSRGGVNVNVTLQDPGSQPRGESRPQVTSAPREAFAPEDSVVLPSAQPVLSSNQVNLVL